MNPVTEFTMAASTTFNSILNEIQMSKLNFTIQLTPFSAYITLKKTTQVNKDGIPLEPSPPTFMLLQKAYQDQYLENKENEKLSLALKDSEKKCDELTISNIDINKKLKSLEASLADVQAVNENLMMKIKGMDKQIANLINCEETIKGELKLEKKQHIQYVRESDSKIHTLNKTIKNKDKEIYNLTKNLKNSRENIANIKVGTSELKAAESKLKSQIKHLEKRLQKFEARQVQSVSCQTSHMTIYTLDVAEPPQILLNSQLSLKTQPGCFSQSMPSINYIEGLDEKIKCNFCGLNFITSSELDHHNDLYKFGCWLCFTCFRSAQEWDLHCCLGDGNG